MTTMTTICEAAEAAVRADYRAGILHDRVDAYEAAKAELTVRAEDVGFTFSRLVLASTAQKVSVRATA